MDGGPALGLLGDGGLFEVAGGLGIAGGEYLHGSGHTWDVPVAR